MDVSAYTEIEIQHNKQMADKIAMILFMTLFLSNFIKNTMI